MSCCHVCVKILTHADGCNYGMKEYGRLCNLGLLQFLCSTLKHYLGNIKTENFVCLVEKFLCLRVSVI